MMDASAALLSPSFSRSAPTAAASSMSRRKQQRTGAIQQRELSPSEEAPASGAAAPTAADASADGAAATGSSELDYEARRQQQIQRNQALLTQLTGVDGLSTSLTREQAASIADAKAKSSLQAKEARAQARMQRAERIAMLPRRDMPTRRARGEINYKEDAIALRAATAAAASSSAAAADATADGDSDDSDSTQRVNASLSDFIVPDYASLGRLSASGNPSSKLVSTLPLRVLAPYIGRVIPLLFHSPKASAMSFLVAGWPSQDNAASKRAPPTFNQMSGIQKMANHVAIFININLPDPTALAAATASTTAAAAASSSSSTSKSPVFAVYGNQWVDGGRRITWYAQPTQRVHTPVIGEILAAARAKQASLDGSAVKEQEEYAQAVLQDTAAAAAATPDASSSPAPAAAAAAASSSSRRGSKRKIEAAAVKTEPESVAAVSSATSVAASASPTSSSASASSSSSSSLLPDPPSLLLFLRHPGGPYLYAGCLAYHAHDTTRTPMKFVFTLTEFDTLRHSEGFNALLPAGMAAAPAATRDNSNK